MLTIAIGKDGRKMQRKQKIKKKTSLDRIDAINTVTQYLLIDYVISI